MQVEGTGVLGITGACAPRLVTPVGSVGSVCAKAQESRVTLAMALERKCAPAMTRSAQVHVHA